MLTSAAGSLVTLKNGHITEGGEVEGRLAFSRTELPPSTFGLEELENGLTVFGSIPAPVLPANVSYQRLQHPAVLFGAAEDPTYHTMDKVVCSRCFNGKAFVLARFTDGNVFAYYDGNVIAAFCLGIVLAGLANRNAQASLAQIRLVGNAIIPAVGALNVSDVTLLANSAYFEVNTADIEDFTPVATYNSAAGSIQVDQIQTPNSGTNAVAAVASFQITGGSAGNITSVQADGVELLAAPVAFSTDDATTASLVASAINSNSTTPKYTASVDQNQINIIADLNNGATPNGFQLQVTTSGDVCLDDCAFALPNVGNGEKCTSVKVLGVEILGVDVQKAGSVDSWAGAVAAQIQANANDYTAFATGTTVRLSKRLRNSADVLGGAGNVAVTLTSGVISAGSSGATNPSLGLVVKLNKTSLSVVAKSKTTARLVSDAITATGFGGTKPYIYAWTQVGSSGAYVSKADSSKTTFFANVDPGQTLIGTFVCTVTDSTAPTALVGKSSFVTITFQNKG